MNCPSNSSAPLSAIAPAIPNAVRQINQVLASAGFRSWLVGGCVRDLLLAEKANKTSPPKDWDLATDADPQQVIRLFRRVIPTGIAHGTVTVVLGREHFEVTTLRGERGHSDGRHPDEVYYVTDIAADLARRDFTVNAMAYDLTSGHLQDPFFGQRDLENKILRAVGDPLQRFEEDGLRVMRCARFAATLELEVEDATRQAIRPSLGSFRKVAVERVRDEWLKALASRRPSRALVLMKTEGLLELIAPALFPADTLAKGPSFEEICELIDASEPRPLRRLALLCCWGIPTADQTDLDRQTAELSRSLKLSGQEHKQLLHLVRHSSEVPGAIRGASGAGLAGARPPADAEPNLALRHWLRSVGRESLEEVIAFQAELRGDEGPQLANRLRHSIEGELATGLPLSVGELALTGGELIAELGLRPGPAVGQILRQLFDATLQDPSLNERSQLLSRARQLLDEAT